MTYSPVFRPARARYLLFVGLLAASALLTGALPTCAWANPTVSVTEDGLVRLVKDSVSTTADGSLTATVTVTIDRPTSYLEARLQMRTDAGRLIYQKTEVFSRLSTGTVDIRFERTLPDLAVGAGSYPIELRVRSDSTEVREWNITDRLLVWDPRRESVPVVLVANINGMPSFDSYGRFVRDPALTSRARLDAQRIAQLVIDNPRLRMTLAVPPFLLEEWHAISQGYEVLREDRVVAVPANDPTARSYASALDAIGRAVATGRLELLHLPYAMPDTGVLQDTGRLEDLSEHLRRAAYGYRTVLEATPTAGTLLSEGLPRTATQYLTDAGIEFMISGVGTLQPAEETTPPSGVYKSGAVGVLLSDEAVSQALSAADADSALDAIFARAVSKDATMPLIAVIEMGSGPQSDSEAIHDAILSLVDPGWLTSISADKASEHPDALPVTLAETILPASEEKADYWQTVTEARIHAAALVEVAGLENPVARSADAASLLAQGRMWAGPDGRWAAVDRGLAFANSALRESQSIFEAVSISAPTDLTLSSSRGEVPLSITNESGADLELRITALGDGLLTNAEPKTLQIRPQENFITVPVDLESSISGRLGVELWAGDIRLAHSETTVRASYIDRLVIVGSVVLVMLGLLLFVRKRVLPTLRADNISGTQK